MNNATLRDFLDLARREMPEVSDEFWPRLEGLASTHYGPCWLYVNAVNKKVARLAEIAAAPDLSSVELARRLHCTPRNIQRMRKLLRDASLPQPVINAAKQISDDPRLLVEIAGDWMILEMVAASSLGNHAAPKDSTEYKAALDGLRSFMKFAGENGARVKELVTLDWVKNGTDHHGELSHFDSTMSGITDLVELLERCSNGDSGKRRTKEFLPLLAWRVCEWLRLVGLPRPLLSNNSSAVKLMMAIASAFRVQLGPESHVKALSAALK